MKYTKEITDRLINDYKTGISVLELAESLEVPKRSVVAKLSSLGVYQKKAYLTKRGEVPIKKSEYINRISVLLNMNPELLESLEKVNKGVLVVIERELTRTKLALGEIDPQPEQVA